jgi:hypothetical protein
VPHQARLDATETFHDVMIRGIERSSIFAGGENAGEADGLRPQIGREQTRWERLKTVNI